MSNNTDKTRFRLHHSDRSIAMATVLRHAIIGEEFFNFICGNLLGSGIHRYVFEYKPSPSWVIKIDAGDRNANVMEEEMWQYVQHSKIAKWFAPVKNLSPCGRILLQKKCTQGVPHAQYPKKIPEFFADTKYANWGKLNGNMVCLDYANSLVMNTGLFSGKMKPAEWWGE